MSEYYKFCVMCENKNVCVFGYILKVFFLMVYKKKMVGIFGVNNVGCVYSEVSEGFCLVIGVFVWKGCYFFW